VLFYTLTLLLVLAVTILLPQKLIAQVPILREEKNSTLNILNDTKSDKYYIICVHTDNPDLAYFDSMQCDKWSCKTDYIEKYCKSS
jgi:hypothetical protein